MTKGVRGGCATNGCAAVSEATPGPTPRDIEPVTERAHPGVTPNTPHFS